MKRKNIEQQMELTLKELFSEVRSKWLSYLKGEAILFSKREAKQEIAATQTTQVIESVFQDLAPLILEEVKRKWNVHQKFDAVIKEVEELKTNSGQAETATEIKRKLTAAKISANVLAEISMKDIDSLWRCEKIYDLALEIGKYYASKSTASSEKEEIKETLRLIEDRVKNYIESQTGLSLDR